jgi:hypothetical protein
VRAVSPWQIAHAHQRRLEAHRAHHQELWLEECRRRQERNRASLVERATRKGGVARGRFHTGRAKAATVVDGTVYWRREFPSIDRSPRRQSFRREPRSRRVRTGTRSARTLGARGDPSSSSDEPPLPELARTAAAASGRMVAHLARRTPRRFRYRPEEAIA